MLDTLLFACLLPLPAFLCTERQRQWQAEGLAVSEMSDFGPYVKRLALLHLLCQALSCALSRAQCGHNGRYTHGKQGTFLRL